MPDIEELGDLIEELLRWLRRYRRQNRVKENPAMQRAVADLLVALSETKIYIERSASTGRSTSLRNLRLARLWHLASNSMRSVDPALAMRFELKSGAWRSPDEWPSDRIRTSKIAISDVENELKRLRSHAKRRKI